MRISSIVIAKNEEQNIGRCIESQLDCFDDIHIFVDESSTDKTFDVASAYKNVNIHKVIWKGYSETKREALLSTENDWVFWIDADEAVTAGLAGEIVEFKNSSPEFDAYSVPRKAFFLGKWIRHCGWYPDRVTRLFNKSKVKFSDNRVHEHLIYEGGTGLLVNDLEHFTDPDIEHYFKKFNSYTSLAAKELHKSGRKSQISDILLRPAFIFFKMFLLKRGFLDGLHGFILSIFSSLYVFTKYCKLWELNNTDKK